MPWCATCDRFLSPPTVTPTGTCPDCGRPVEPGAARPGGAAEPGPDEQLPPVPRHLKLLGVAMVVYLGYRFAQGVEWVVHRF